MARLKLSLTDSINFPLIALLAANAIPLVGFLSMAGGACGHPFCVGRS